MKSEAGRKIVANILSIGCLRLFVVIEGKLSNNNYIDKDVNKKYPADVHVKDLLLMGKASV